MKLFYSNLLFNRASAYKCAFFGFLFLIFGLISILPSTFASLTPVKKVEIKSEKLDYDNKTSGAWKVTKSAKWVGRAQGEITFNLDSILRNRKKYTDIIFVLDTSASMVGSKLERVQRDTLELLEDLLSNAGNRAALITFTDTSSILSGFTSDKTLLTSYVNNISLGVNTNYYRAFQSVDTVLKEYKSEADRECIVLFLTDGWPNRNTPNEVGQYNYLKKQYPFTIINGIQYEMGDEIMPQIVRVSDNQFNASFDTLRNVLFEASAVASKYDTFSITDYIDDRYFYVEDVSDIVVDKGKVKFDSKTQQIDWMIDEFNSGKTAEMKIKIKLKDELIGNGGVYPTNIREEIHSKIGDDIDDVTSELTPILADNYKVSYDGNAPDDCDVSGVPLAKNHSVYDTVEVSDNVPICNGYHFKKWEIVENDVTRLNNDYFIMPEANVTLRAVWKKLKVNKSSDGELAAAQTIYDMMADNSVLDDRASEFVTAETGIDFNKISSDTNGRGIYELASTKNNKYPVYYYRGAVENNVKFANICWKIVRTTDTGGVKLIYNGVPDTNGWCNNVKEKSQLSGTYNASTTVADVGYMYGQKHVVYDYFEKNSNGTNKSQLGFNAIYGNDVEWDGSKYTLKDTFKSTAGHTKDRSTIYKKYHYSCWSTTATSCTSVYYFTDVLFNNYAYYFRLSDGKKIEDVVRDIFSNENDSEIKKTIDSWYSSNLLSYTSFLEDTIWCNNRAIIDGPLLKESPTSSISTLYDVYDRVPLGVRLASSKPNLTCPQKADCFTVSENNGNGKLTYPVATITAEEANMAGAAYSVNQSYYLFSNSKFFTMTPAFSYAIYDAGGTWSGGSGTVSLYSASPTTSSGIRPMVSLRSGMRIASGDGSVYDPYIVQMS